VGKPDDFGRLEKTTNLLEEIIADRTRELAAAVSELESFSYSVAHDLRAPLRAINSFTQALVEDYGDRFEGEAGLYLDRICKASERMSLLIDDLLKLSRVGRGEISRGPVALSTMIVEIAARVADRHPGRSVRMIVPPALTATGDARLLAIAFENVLDNAWKFTRLQPNAEITVSATSSDDRLEICVADNGAGFDMRYSHKLFAPFQRLHRAEEFEGTGIGLVTVSRIVARHGGQVSIAAELGKGARVHLFLPIVDKSNRV
jgi:light-regulated signal transduction histidine kinase (bacteriophytochrome)